MNIVEHLAAKETDISPRSSNTLQWDEDRKQAAGCKNICHSNLKSDQFVFDLLSPSGQKKSMNAALSMFAADIISSHLKVY